MGIKCSEIFYGHKSTDWIRAGLVQKRMGRGSLTFIGHYDSSTNQSIVNILVNIP